MFNLNDLQSFCDDLSDWIIKLNCVDEIEKAYPRGEFPLKADENDLEDGWDVLIYLTVWMCLKNKIKAPSHLESRILLLNTKGPWQKIYLKISNETVYGKEFSEIFNLAS
jgi:hypothetical protein